MYTKKPGSKGGDGPWPEHRYRTMTNEAIAALPVVDLAADNAHVYVWATNVMLTRQRWGWPDPVEIVKLWGFEPKTIITWVKTGPPGLGRYFRGNTEHVVFGVRGDAPIPPSVRLWNVFEAPRGRHSEKPDVFMDRVEAVSPGPYLEMFSRRARFGWDTWGDEALHGTEAMSA